MSLFIDEFKAELGYRVSLVFWAVVTLFVVIAGPFGSYQTMPLLMRIVLGVPLMVFLMIIGITIRAVVFRYLGARGVRIASVVTAVVAGMVMAPLAQLMLKVMQIGGELTRPGLLELGVLVISLSLGHSSVRRVLDVEADPATEAAEPQDDPAERLLHRLEPEKRGPILAISVRDHYVDVQTRKGQASLLLRFSDAMAEVDPAAGVQVHRSHWVAWDEIETVEREGGKTYLKLKHGGRVPVSKNHRGKLEERGLI